MYHWAIILLKFKDYLIIFSSFDVTSNVSFLRGSNTQLRDVTAGPFTAGPLSDVTPLQCTVDPTPEPHGRTSSRGPSHSFFVVTSISTIGTFEATRLFCLFVFIVRRDVMKEVCRCLLWGETITCTIGRGKFRQKHNYNLAKMMSL